MIHPTVLWEPVMTSDNLSTKNKYVSIVVVAKYSNDAAQQGRTENILRHLWQPLYGPCMTLKHSLQPAGISCMLVFAEGGKPGNPLKNPRSGEDNQHKLNTNSTHLWCRVRESNPGHIGGRRVLLPPRQPCKAISSLTNKMVFVLFPF